MIGAKNDAIVQKLQEHRAKKQSLWPKSQRDNADVEAEKEGDDNAKAGELGRNLSGSEVELEYEGGGETGGELEMEQKSANTADERRVVLGKVRPDGFEGGARSPAASPGRRSASAGRSGSKQLAYASRKAVKHDDSDSQCSNPSEQQEEAEEEEQQEGEVLKPNVQFENYKFQFENLLKHKQVPT